MQTACIQEHFQGFLKNTGEGVRGRRGDLSVQKEHFTGLWCRLLLAAVVLGAAGMLR